MSNVKGWLLLHDMESQEEREPNQVHYCNTAAEGSTIQGIQLRPNRDLPPHHPQHHLLLCTGNH